FRLNHLSSLQPGEWNGNGHRQPQSPGSLARRIGHIAGGIENGIDPRRVGDADVEHRVDPSVGARETQAIACVLNRSPGHPYFAPVLDGLTHQLIEREAKRVAIQLAVEASIGEYCVESLSQRSGKIDFR